MALEVEQRGYAEGRNIGARGYVPERGFDLPPLMLTSDEIDAVVLAAGVLAKMAPSGSSPGASLAGRVLEPVKSAASGGPGRC